MNELEKEAILQEYIMAYNAAHPGTNVSIIKYGSGWYSVCSDGASRMGSKIRLSTLVKMGKRLRNRVKNNIKEKTWYEWHIKTNLHDIRELEAEIDFINNKIVERAKNIAESTEALLKFD